MIRARVERDGADRRLCLSGHATGHPEVCAAVSCLICALAGYLRDPAGVRLEKGEAQVRCLARRENDGAFDMVLVGLTQLGRKYPQCLRMEQGTVPGTALGSIREEREKG